MLASNDLEKISQCMSVKPYSYLTAFGVSENRIDKQFKDNIETQVEKGALLFIERKANYISSFALYKYLGFDTRILGLKTAKIELIALNKSSDRKSCIKRLLDFVKREKIMYLTCRLSTKDLQTIQLLEKNGFCTVDGYLTLMKNLVPDTSTQKARSDIKIRRSTARDIKPLQDSIAATFIYSKFVTDEAILNGRGIEMYQKWIENSINGKVAEAVYVADIKGKRVGFITLEMDHIAERYFGLKIGHIPLVGVHPEYRNMGIAGLLTNTAIKRWFTARNAKYVRVESQVANLPAIRVYEKLGFMVTDSGQTLRWHTSAR